MSNKIINLIALLLTILGLDGLQAQESVNATGANASGSGGSVSYSVGQITYQTQTGSNGSVAEGVQQPYEISVITTIDEAREIHLTVMAYPNPTNDFLTLEMKYFKPLSYQFQLYDMSGKLMHSEKIMDHHTHIDVSFLTPGTYFLKLTEGNRDYKSFKIIKK